ncbi:unnamed protein product [Linum trigynum]|uniref:Uncharacterized protein n=1 Tax=Linum trigynum TaxID=586398 RepID=A0AAV2CPH6_9ROSI
MCIDNVNQVLHFRSPETQLNDVGETPFIISAGDESSLYGGGALRDSPVNKKTSETRHRSLDREQKGKRRLSIL